MPHSSKTLGETNKILAALQSGISRQHNPPPLPQLRWAQESTGRSYQREMKTARHKKTGKTGTVTEIKNEQIRLEYKKGKRITKIWGLIRNFEIFPDITGWEITRADMEVLTRVSGKIGSIFKDENMPVNMVCLCLDMIRAGIGKIMGTPVPPIDVPSSFRNGSVVYAGK